MRIAAHGQHASVVDRARVQLIPGAQIPGTHYRLVRWLGEVAVGTLYEAEDLKHERTVVFEVLRSDIASHVRAVRRARAEARVANDLRSPYIAQLYEFGEISDGRLMIVREHLEGRRLRDIEEKMELPRLVPILRQLCKALAAAHSVGIVHGDIKPENVQLQELDGRSDAVKLNGFGVASLLDGPGELGRTAGGSPYYLAPERWRGAPREPRSDIYAFGCLAYEIWVGHPPFSGGELDEIMNGHCETAPEPLPARGHSKGLAAVIMRCLAKDPADRFENAEELEAALIEAQVSAKWVTPWDDLPVPDLDESRRQSLMDALRGLSMSTHTPAALSNAGQPSPRDSGRRGVQSHRRGFFRMVVVIAIIAGAGGAWMHYGSQGIAARVRSLMQPQVASQVQDDTEAVSAEPPRPSVQPAVPDVAPMRAEVVESEPRATPKKKSRRPSRRRTSGLPVAPTKQSDSLPGLEAQGPAAEESATSPGTDPEAAAIPPPAKPAEVAPTPAMPSEDPPATTQ